MREFSEQEALFLLIKKLQEKNFYGIKFYIREEERKELELCCGKPEFSVEARDRSCFIEAGKNGKRCSCFFDSPKEWETIMDLMEESAFVSGQPYKYIPLSVNTCDDLEEERDWSREKEEKTILAGLLEGEKEALGCDRIDFLRHCKYIWNRSRILLMDENGSSLTDKDHYGYVSIEAVAREKASTATGRAGSYGEQAKDVPFQKLGRMAAERGIQGLHAGSIVSGEYPVILKNHVAAEILEAFLPAFYGDRIQNGLSCLSGKEGEKIGENSLNLTEEPGHLLGRCKRRIDDEGVPVSRKYLIHQGVWEQSVYNQASALKAGKKSTGNGFKTDSGQDISVGVTNVLLSTESGKEKTLEEMMNSLEHGLLVGDVFGVFAGTDVVNGDFSLLVSGNVIRDGQLGQAFCQAVISGNFLDMLCRIEAIGNDPEALGPELSCVISPSIQIKNLVVSGY